MLPYAQVLKCRFCKMFAGLLDNPYHYSGQVIAKLSVNLATMIWAGVVLFKRDALATWPATISPYGSFTEDMVALGLLFVSVVATTRLVRKSPPIGLGVCAYAIFLMLWLYTFVTLLLAINAGIAAVRPGQLAGVIVITALAIFAFVSNPKQRYKYGSPSD